MLGAEALAGITVLDLSTVGPGTRCTRILADYGARVVKVGAPPRRAGVQVEPHHWAYSARRGWAQVRIDLKAEDGKGAFLKLAEQADVVLESYRPGVVDRLGIGYPDVKAVNPRIIYCSTTKEVDAVWGALKAMGVPAHRYHGGMKGSERKAEQELFMKRGRRLVMVATSAFGLGIDKRGTPIRHTNCADGHTD